jgi:VIT1/CCC1 family predicted Fe2+/Mn2+ transporter
MTLRGLRQLVTLLTVVIGVVAAIAALVWLVGGTSAHRAFTLVFYAGGACLLLFALLTSGAEGRGPSDRAINPTGALVLAAVGTLALGVVFEALL